MEGKANQPCANCQHLEAQLQRLQAEIASLRASLVQLQEQLARARKDSSTSSKPPSSDLVKPATPPPADGQTKRRNRSSFRQQFGTRLARAMRLQRCVHVRQHVLPLQPPR